jgi:hypothetical protein
VRISQLRRTAIAGAGALTLLLAGCNGDDDQAQPPPVEEPEPDPDGPGEPVDPELGADPEDDVEDDPEEPADDPDDGPEEDEADDDIDPLDGEPTTGPDEADGEAGTLAVTEVRVATHAGFDRIVFETEGDGVPGWFVDYGDATSQGSGEPVEVEGEVTLRVAVDMVTLPPDLPDGIEVWDGERLDGPAGGVVAEVVEDTIFEGIHLFFVGLDEQRPFLVERFDDPHRVVLDIPHGG